MVDVFAESNVQEGQGLRVGVVDKGIAFLTANGTQQFNEANAERCHRLTLCIGQFLPALLLKLYVPLHQFLQFCLALLEDSAGEVALTVEEVLVLAVELVFHTQCLCLKLLLQHFHLLLHLSIFRHRLDSCLITEVAETESVVFLGGDAQENTHKYYDAC